MHIALSLSFAASIVLTAAPEAPTPASPPVARAVQQMPPELAEPILGRDIAGVDGKTVARLVDVLIDAEGVPQAAIIDFGGFLGVGNRRIAVRWDTLHFAPADPRRPITLDMTPDEVKAAPAYTNPSKPTSVVTPDPAPVVPPDPAPVVTPDPAPVVTPDPAPVVTPDPAPRSDAAAAAPAEQAPPASPEEQRSGYDANGPPAAPPAPR